MATWTRKLKISAQTLYTDTNVIYEDLLNLIEKNLRLLTFYVDEVGSPRRTVHAIPSWSVEKQRITLTLEATSSHELEDIWTNYMHYDQQWTTQELKNYLKTLFNSIVSVTTEDTAWFAEYSFPEVSNIQLGSTFAGLLDTNLGTTRSTAMVVQAIHHFSRNEVAEFSFIKNSPITLGRHMGYWEFSDLTLNGGTYYNPNTRPMTHEYFIFKVVGLVAGYDWQNPSVPGETIDIAVPADTLMFTMQNPLNQEVFSYKIQNLSNISMTFTTEYGSCEASFVLGDKERVYPVALEITDRGGPGWVDYEVYRDYYNAIPVNAAMYNDYL